MKVMKRLLLIHWHYFTHETIYFDKINFLTGKNASGKSTIVDALQLVLLCDTSGTFFNKAARGRGNRTLSGYLRGELGDDEESGFRYLREGRFTSYIALEFYDEEKDKFFTVGCCFDTYAENDMQKLFFRFDNAMPDHEFIVDKVPMDITALRLYIKERYTAGHSYTTDVNRDFKQDLYGKLGGLRDRFGQLLKKAVSFNPNVDIQQFISEFVCDPQQTVDVSRMQENIRSYKNLERETSVLKERIELLSQIIDTHQAFATYRQNEILYSYLIDRARLSIKENELSDARQRSDIYRDKLTSLKSELEQLKTEQSRFQNERDIMQVNLHNNKQAQVLEQMQTQIAEKEQQIRVLNNELQRYTALLVRNVTSWFASASALLQIIKGVDYSIINPILVSRIDALIGESEQLLGDISSLRSPDVSAILNVGKDGLLHHAAAADSIKSQSDGLVRRFDEEQKVVAINRTALQKEQQSLESGIYQFPQDVIDLKEAIYSHLHLKSGSAVKVAIVAEVAEIKNDRWRNVIEGYLNTQKYYLIVAPEHFSTAIQVYDHIKRQKSIYNTGIVDVEKLKRLTPTRDPGSLAEEIDTDDPNVRLFLDFTLGRVKKCEHVGELRRHRTAVTDDGMLYQNFVVRAMNPNRWEKPAIGQCAIKQRLEAVKREIMDLTEKILMYSSIKSAFGHGSGIVFLSQSDAEQIIASATNFGQIPEIEQEIQRLNREMETVDRSAVDALQKRIAQLGETLSELGKNIEQQIKDSGALEEQLRVCSEETIPKLTKELIAMRVQLEETFPSEWVEETGAPRYIRELSTRGDAANIERAFPRELSRSVNAKDAMWDELRNSRRKYNDSYKMGHDVNAVDNEVYDNAWLELSDIKLPDYLSKIEDARSKAFEQFQEDFLSRLQNNINDAKRQIDGLNSALSGSSFGEDTYRFRIVARPEYKRYYDMIVDPMLLEGGYNLLTEQYNAKYKEEIAELFSIITNESENAKAQAHDDYEKRVQAFTDYRTYLTFDLEVINKDGESQRLSKTLGKKSGGETQTPFYIAVLASFAQLYRIGRDRTANTSRIILFDEAFSKMDGERIVLSVELLRQFNFQVVLSAPPDKIGDIATLVDRNLCVLRNGKKACVRSFDPRQLEELINE